MYRADLKAYGATCVPPHRLFDRNRYRDVLRAARAIWEEKYPNEPFGLPLEVEQVAAGAESNQIKLQYDLVDAVKRQQMFYYQVGARR